MKSSTHIELSGVTVFEPMILKEPDNVEDVDVTGVVGVLPQPARKEARSSITARGMSHILVDGCKLFSPLLYFIPMVWKRFCPSITRIQWGL
jgi:hypothetical protein